MDRLLQRAGPRQDALAVLTPHGSFQASGSVAGALFSRIRCPETAVVVGPDHSGLGKPCSLERRGDWVTPLGSLPVDEGLARRILEMSDDVTVDPETHSEEHAVEMILPFLQRTGSIRRFVPMALAADDPQVAHRVGLGIAAAVQGFGRSVLVVASAHLTCYQPSTVAQKNDPGTLQRILAMDEEGLWRWITEQRASMCGCAAVGAVLAAAKALGASGGHLVKYEVRSPSAGEPDSVNGYAGVIFQ